MQLSIVNGPNLNLLGKREPEIYGSQSFEEYFQQLQLAFPEIQLSYFQNNSEGALVSYLHEVGYSHDGIVLNAASYTHTSIALADAIAAIDTPVIEVHISNVYKREAFRHKSYTAPNCIGSIIGLGLPGYALAIQYFQNHYKR